MSLQIMQALKPVKLRQSVHLHPAVHSLHKGPAYRVTSGGQLPWKQPEQTLDV